MEAEEVQLDFDDSVSTDDDQPSKKKRKCWKNHKVDRDEGTYGCDQCNKVFSKQSSLARHKYEHSGKTCTILLTLTMLNILKWLDQLSF
jgi:zinc finger homeobox protein 1/2